MNNSFIKKDCDRLMLDGNEFRFISFNVPNLHMAEDPNWHLPDEWEQEDAIRSISEIGGRVLRIYTFSVAPVKPFSHVEEPRKFNEQMFRCLDKALSLCAKYGIYMIIPFVDNSSWWGGVLEYAAFRGKTPYDKEFAGQDTDEIERRLRTEFYTNEDIRNDFKATIEYVLNRTNVYTGIKYKDDPTIMCWELGNEVWSATKEWKIEMSGFIKSIDPNHLIMDGAHLFNPQSLEVDDIDIVTAHYYETHSPNYASACAQDRQLAKGKKPFIVGEFGLSTTENCESLLNEVIENGTSGALIWSLRSHSVNGGFYFHSDNKTLSYHYPGFNSNSAYDEKQIIEIIRDRAVEISGIKQKLPIPDAPKLLSINNGEIIFRGSTGAYAYDIYKSNGKEEFKLLASDVEDCVCNVKTVDAKLPIYKDFAFKSGDSYYVQAKSTAGISPKSNILKS